MKKTHDALRRPLLSTAVGLLLVGQFAVCQNALAAGGDFSMDFTAAAPLTYNHATGGGAYNDRTVGRDQDIVESLEGGDFSCGDTVTFLTQIEVDDAAAGAQSIRLRFEFTAHSTGQQGTALVDNVNGTSAAINGGAIDTGTVDDNGSAASVFDESLNGAVFVKPTTFFRSVDVTDLEGGETVVVRTDVAIVCNGQSPTGNMQARLASASVINSSGVVIDGISVGDQTVPFKRVGDIKPCDPKACPPPPK